MTETAIICPSCGAKVRDTHVRCPRCRVVLAAPAETSAPSNLARNVSLGILAVATAGTLAVLWNSREPAAPPPAAAAAGGDSPAARGPIEPGAGGTAAASAAGDIPPDPAFARSSRLVESSDVGDEAALDRLRASIAQNPQDAAALTDAGRILQRLGRLREALQPLKQSMELQPDQWAPAFTYGLAAARANEWSEAAAAFERARGVTPGDAPTSYDLALARQKLRAYTAAVDEYHAAIALDSAAAGPRLGLAISLDRLGRASEAADAYRDYLRNAPAGPDADRVTARLKRLAGS